jgi:hypothetical protein
MVIGREYRYVMSTQQLTAFEQRHTHINTGFFCFIGSGDDATIVVAQDYDRLAAKIRTKKPFARTIKTITIDDGVHIQMADDRRQKSDVRIHEKFTILFEPKHMAYF